MLNGKSCRGYRRKFVKVRASENKSEVDVWVTR